MARTFQIANCIDSGCDAGNVMGCVTIRFGMLCDVGCMPTLIDTSVTPNRTYPPSWHSTVQIGADGCWQSCDLPVLDDLIILGEFTGDNAASLGVVYQVLESVSADHSGCGDQTLCSSSTMALGCENCVTVSGVSNLHDIAL